MTEIRSSDILLSDWAPPSRSRLRALLGQDAFWTELAKEAPWVREDFSESDLFEMLWQNESLRLRREVSLAPARHWSRGHDLRAIFLHGVIAGDRSLPEAFQRQFPGQIENYWESALPRAAARKRARRLIEEFWGDQARALGIEADWQEAFAAGWNS